MTFNDDLLVTCSRDDNIKFWRLSGEEAVPTFECEVSVGPHVLLDSLKPHSTAANILATAALGDAYVVDVERKTSVISLTGYEDKGQSMDWSDDGKLLAISADKGRQVSEIACIPHQCFACGGLASNVPGICLRCPKWLFTDTYHGYTSRNGTRITRTFLW
ncbi:unnamed protein product [Cylicostephanus goldi]|uniref:Coronin-7 n=1 Tax=Cylicostephanus goldi TaxID=71465 RepID=A0A3P6SMR6_CYLGO|nr:unnamed protein product [Cylicostephanus goldi]